MSIIRTNRNLVAAYEPLPSDGIVMTRIGNETTFKPIMQYYAEIKNAVAMADHVPQHIDIVPMGIEEFVELKTGMTMVEFLKTLPSSTLQILEQDCINTCREAIRYCEDADVKEQAAAVLKIMEK